MKKIVLSMALALFCLTANVAKSQIDFHAGYVQNSIVTSQTVLGLTHNDTVSHSGVYVGFGNNFKILGDLGLNVGVNAEYYQGTETTSYLGVAGAEARSQELDLAVPVQLNYTLPLTLGTKVTVFAGPNFYFGLVNKTDYKYTVMGATVEKTENHFEHDDASTEDFYLERFALNATVGLSVNFAMVGVHAGYTFSMTDLTSGSESLGKSGRIFAGVNFNL